LLSAFSRARARRNLWGMAQPDPYALNERIAQLAAVESRATCLERRFYVHVARFPMSVSELAEIIP
jgi:hypothetical protein